MDAVRGVSEMKDIGNLYGKNFVKGIMRYRIGHNDRKLHIWPVIQYAETDYKINLGEIYR